MGFNKVILDIYLINCWESDIIEIYSDRSIITVVKQIKIASVC